MIESGSARVDSCILTPLYILVWGVIICNLGHFGGRLSRKLLDQAIVIRQYEGSSTRGWGTVRDLIDHWMFLGP